MEKEIRAHHGAFGRGGVLAQLPVDVGGEPDGDLGAEQRPGAQEDLPQVIRPIGPIRRITFFLPIVSICAKKVREFFPGNGVCHQPPLAG